MTANEAIEKARSIFKEEKRLPLFGTICLYALLFMIEDLTQVVSSQGSRSFSSKDSDSLKSEIEQTFINLLKKYST